jgi:hypothetical protein
LLATLVTIPSYLDAKKAADDAGLEEFDEATYNAERDKYMARYKANLPDSAFGIKQQLMVEELVMEMEPNHQQKKTHLLKKLLIEELHKLKI